MNGRRVFAACEQLLKSSLVAGHETTEIYEMLEANTDGLFTLVLDESHLDIGDEEAARAFCKAKIDAFFQRRVFKPTNDKLSFSEP